MTEFIVKKLESFKLNSKQKKELNNKLAEIDKYYEDNFKIDWKFVKNWRVTI